MKRIVILFLLTGLLMACDFDSSQTITYQVNEPVFMTADEFRNSIKTTNEIHELSNQGKICFYKGYMYISERGKGVHIINNTNPENPEIVGYIEMLGNYDLFVYNNLLYADALVDLVWFDITRPENPLLKGRAENAFSEIMPPIENDFGYDYALCQEGIGKGGVIVGWELKQRVREIKNEGWNYGENNEPPFFEKPLNSSTGSGGFVSHFNLSQGYLYAVVNNYMSVFNLSGASPVKIIDDEYVRGEVETIFSYQDKLFLMMPTGLKIYSIENPQNPVFCSDIPSVYSCNPIVIKDDLAYVTIRSGNSCDQNLNELAIYDLSDIYNPQRVVSYAMHNPKGLGIDEENLFLCDEGLKIFKVENSPLLVDSIPLLVHYKEINASDVIPHDNILLTITDNALYQYDYSDLNDIKELSKISFHK